MIRAVPNVRVTVTARSLGVLLVLLLVSSAAVVSAVVPPPSSRWIELKTPHFTFYSSASERATRRIATDLEELRAVLSKLTTLDLRAGVPILIYIFKSDTQFLPYKPLYDDRPANLGGYFLARPHAAYIAIDGSSRGKWQSASALIYHEYVHHFLDSNLTQVPLWFGEGMAEYYQTFQISGGKVRIGQPIAAHISRLRGTAKLIPLSQLLVVDHDSPEYHEGEAQSLFYAQSWALVHYLAVGNRERTPQLDKFLSLAVAGLNAEEAFHRAFGTGYSKLEQELRAYVHRSIFKHREQPLEIDLKTSVTSRTLPYPRVLCLLGDLLSQLDPLPPQAQEHFTAALRIEPDYPPALAGLGFLRELEGDWDEAAELYARAAAGATDDYLIQYRFGVALEQGEGDTGLMIAALRRSTQLDATFEPAWVKLCRNLAAHDPGTPGAVNDVETALQIMPERSDIAFHLLTLYLRAGRQQAARDLVRQSFAANPGYQKRARQLLFQYDLRLVYNLICESKLAEAELALDRIDSRLTGSESAIFQDQITGFRRDIERIRMVDLYNEASRLYEEGKHAEARSVLTELLECDSDLPLTESARSLVYLIDHGEEKLPPSERESPFLAAVNRFNRLLEQGKLQEALQLLEQMKQQATGDSGWLERKIAEIRRVLVYNRFIDTYNRAVDLFNNADYTGARRLIQELLPDLPEGPEAQMAHDLLQDIRKRLRQDLDR